MVIQEANDSSTTPRIPNGYDSYVADACMLDIVLKHV